ncbi:MAG: 5-exo-alcohol dehydrogenase [Candidatus Tectimicrobiota bacterium]|nr:MAG: 5-exo-alcohol dehydrogenase [Candidatus Tectomicrobia bacterium]
MSSVPKSSRAACLVAFGQPLEIRELPIPETLEPGAVLVRTEVASICGSDVHLWQGEVGVRDRLPLPVVLGHEMVGRVVRLGPGVSRDSVGQPLAEGDRIVWTHASCGECYACTVTHQPTLCPRRRMYMFTSCQQPPYLVGGFAEYVYVWPTSGRVKVPDEVPSELASAASCALRTVVHGFDRLGRLEDYETVVIQGAGPLGLFAAAMALRAGVHQVILIGAPAVRLEVARQWGVTHTLDLDAMPDARERLRYIRACTEGRGADVVIEVSGGATAFPEGVAMLRRGGRYLVIGQVGGHEVALAPRLIVEKQLTVLGVMSGDVDHYYKALQFLKHNRERFRFEALLSNRYRLEQINEALEAMRQWREIKPVVVLA